MREKASVILSMVIFGTIGIFVEYIDLPSGVIASFRGITGAIVILAVMLLSGKKIDFKSVKKKIKVLVVSGVAIGFNWILLFDGVLLYRTCNRGGSLVVCVQKEAEGKADYMCASCYGRRWSSIRGFRGRRNRYERRAMWPWCGAPLCIGYDYE